MERNQSEGRGIASPPPTNERNEMQTVREIIRDVVETTTLSDPRIVTEKVIERIEGPNDDVRPARLYKALREVLPSFIQTSFSRRRLLPSPVTTAVQAQEGSAKVAACRDAWADLKRAPLVVGDTWKRLGECTADDLRTVAEQLRTTASRTLAKAEWYEEIADALPEGCKVDDLDHDPTGAVR